MELILMPWPCRGFRPPVRAAALTLSRNFVLVRGGACALISRRRGVMLRLAELIRKWFWKATVGSVSPFWETLYTSSPSVLAAVVEGRRHMVTL